MAYSAGTLIWSAFLFKTTDARVVNARLARMTSGMSYTLTFGLPLFPTPVTVPRAQVAWHRYKNGIKAVNSLTGALYGAWIIKTKDVGLSV